MEFICEHCNKGYKSYQSRWNHIKKHHNDILHQITPNEHQNPPELHQKPPKSTKNHPHTCKYCNKIFSRVDSLTRHQKDRCKGKNEVSDEKISMLVRQNEELKELLLKAMKIHPKTLSKINKQLNNNGTINNINNQNIINIVPLGHENLSDILSDKDKLRILNKRGNGLKEIVDLVHVSDKFTQFKNVYITNLQNTIGYKFDQKNNQFIAVNKSELLDDLIDCRMLDIEQFYDNLENKLDPETSKIVKRFIDRMNDNDDELKGIKKEEIKLYLYNSRDKIKKTSNIEL